MQKNKILVVDDDKANLDILNHTLQNEYMVYVAKSGEMAVKRALADQPDLILLDIVMPDMSGYDVLKLLKEDDATKAIPVIFLTALNNATDEERGFLLGAVDYIVKPFNNSILKSRIKVHMKALKKARVIERMGTFDVLTELANRRSFEIRLISEWERESSSKAPLSIISVDIDEFKQYNETYGYLQGDVLLQTMASIFSDYLHTNADIVARIDGDEFAFLLPDTDKEEALEIANTIRHAVEVMEVPNMGPMTSQVTIKIGVATKIPKVGECALSLLEEARNSVLE